VNSIITVRQGRIEDYPSLLASERKAWAGSEVTLITFEQFKTWLEVFPSGLLLAEHQGEICGHHFSQICRFDLHDVRDNRSWDTITDRGFCRTTHDPAGNVLYGVSLSSSVRGAGRMVLTHAIRQASDLKLDYYIGACRMPGLAMYATSLNLPMDEVVASYVEAVAKQRIYDKTLSTLLKAGVQAHRPIPNYFHDQQSGNWGCLISFRVGC
jgi:hypothetical protein